MVYLTHNTGELSAQPLSGAPLKRGFRTRCTRTDVLKIKPTFNSIKIAETDGKTEEIQLRQENRLLNDLRSGYSVESRVPLRREGQEITVRWEARHLSSTASHVISKVARDMSLSEVLNLRDLEKHIQEIPELRMPFLLISQQVIYPEAEAKPSRESGFENWYLEEM